MYKLTESGVQRLSDNAWIPDSEDNRDWMKYQQWLSEGNDPLPMDQPAPPSIEELTQSKIQALKLAADGAVSDILYEYPEVEKATFLRQEHQAYLYLEWYNGDQKTSQPVVTTVERIANERGLSILELSNRIIINAQYFDLASSTVCAQRQRLYDELMLIVKDDTLTDEQKRDQIRSIDESQICLPESR